MPKFDCAYCGTSLTHDSLSVRNKHFNGKNHSRNVEIYWRVVAREEGLMPRDPSSALIPRPDSVPFVDPLDQAEELRRSMPTPGLDDITNSEPRPLPPPANIPTPRHPQAFLG